MLEIFKAKSDVIADDIDISLIRTDGETQMRAKLNEETVSNYAEKMREGVSFPPVELYYDGEHYWIGDGFHRIAAHKLAHADASPTPPIVANVRSGSRRKAILHAVGANDTHGLPRTNADKRRAVEIMLHDEEWAQWSDRAIADACKVTHPLVAKLRKELSGNGFQMPTERTVHRNGQTYTQDTAKITAANRERRQPRPESDPTSLPAPTVRLEPPAAALLSPDLPPISKEAQALIQGAPSDRVFYAQIIVRSINAALSHMDAYGQLTGKFLHILPAERALTTMRAELQALIEALGKG